MKETTTGSRMRIAAALIALAALAGCAGIPGPNSRDPLEPYNRKAQQFNEQVDSIVLKPAATAYRENVPPIVRTGVANFFGNLQDVWSAVNSLLQFRMQDAEESLARVQINTIAGLGGIMDVASELNIEKHKEDFGQTLGRWGVPAGPYLVLPILGPSTLRDTAALPIDWQGDLVWRMAHTSERTSLYALRAVDRRANLLRLSDVVDQAALDKYSFTRDAFLQKRQSEVFDFKVEKDTDGAEPKEEDGAAPAAKPASAPRQPASTPAR
jgi:phospholipid-binding lipoprotein MlaA